MSCLVLLQNSHFSIFSVADPLLGDSLLSPTKHLLHRKLFKSSLENYSSTKSRDSTDYFFRFFIIKLNNIYKNFNIYITIKLFYDFSFDLDQWKQFLMAKFVRDLRPPIT